MVSKLIIGVYIATIVSVLIVKLHKKNKRYSRMLVNEDIIRQGVNIL